MRKVWLIILMFLLSVQHVLAADLIYRITHNDQDALVLGEIVQGIGNSYKIDVIHVISGRLPQKTITLHTDFKYFTEDTPMIGDFLVLSLDRKVINYYIKWGAFKVDSGDYKTLKLLKNNLSVGLQGDLAMLERYINSNAKDIDFYYKDEKVYLRKQNGGDELIYPTDELYNNTQKSTTTAVFNNQESGDEAEKSPLVLISLILLLGIGGIVTIRYRNLP